MGKEMHPNSLKNLLPRPPQSAYSKGGTASVKVRRERKLIKEVVEQLLSLPVNSGRVDTIKNIVEAKNKNLTVIEMMTIAQIKKAFSGDTRAFEAVINVIKKNEQEAVNPNNDALKNIVDFTISMNDNASKIGMEIEMFGETLPSDEVPKDE